MDEEEELELDVNPPKSSKMKTILLIVVIALVLNIGGIAAWFFLIKGDDGASSDLANKEGVGEVAKKDLGPITYLTMVPEFVVNFGPGSKVRYLQVDLQVASRDEDALQTVTDYRPVLRNDILVILSGLSFEQLQKRSGKEALQKKILNTINKVVTSATNTASHGEKDAAEGDGAGVDASTENTQDEEDIDGLIENVYFTSFIMQ